MSTVSNLIFKNEKHYITSPYGKRAAIKTSAGTTSSFHNGTDYGTNGKKLAQYAIEDGTVLFAGTASDGAKYVWIKYPRINRKFLHYHLDRISVKTNQSVKKGTLIGYTGQTGKATGIHLHLGIKNLSTDAFEDPEVFAKSYKEPAVYPTGKYKVTASLLNVRSGAGINYSARSFSQLTANAKSQISALNPKKPNGYVKGVVCTVSEVKNFCWGKTPSGWICLDYCVKI